LAYFTAWMTVDAACARKVSSSYPLDTFLSFSLLALLTLFVRLGKQNVLGIRLWSSLVEDSVDASGLVAGIVAPECVLWQAGQFDRHGL
jgi:hypothetical protein